MEALTIKDNEKFLRQISKEVDFEDKELSNDVEVLKEFCKTHSCFAIAAIQLGIAKRIVYVKSTSTDMTENNGPEQLLLINPKVISRKGRTEYWEACVSGLDNFALVERPYMIEVEYQNLSGEIVHEIFEGFAATVVSHELDHLEGIFHMDRAKQLLRMQPSERKVWRETHPYTIFSKDCEFSY